jgi:hypothetical protein
MDSDLELKYEYLPNRPNPAAVFDTMARYVKGYNELGDLLADAVGERDAFTFQLVGVQSGSIIGKFGAAKNCIQSVIVEAIFNSGVRLHEQLTFTEETSTREQVEKLAKTVEGYLANSVIISPHIDRKKFAEVLQSFSSANENVYNGESLEVKSGSGVTEARSRINTAWRFTGDPKEMFANKTEHFEGELKLTVKVQVNQGGQVWTFTSVKNGNTFSAKIMNERWLEDYQEVKIAPISAKDVITAIVKYDIYDSHSGKEIKNAKILDVLSIFRHKAEQSDFDNF